MVTRVDMFESFVKHVKKDLILFLIMLLPFGLFLVGIIIAMREYNE